MFPVGVNILIECKDKALKYNNKKNASFLSQILFIEMNRLKIKDDELNLKIIPNDDFPFNNEHHDTESLIESLILLDCKGNLSTEDLLELTRLMLIQNIDDPYIYKFLKLKINEFKNINPEEKKIDPYMISEYLYHSGLYKKYKGDDLGSIVSFGRTLDYNVFHWAAFEQLCNADINGKNDELDRVLECLSMNDEIDFENKFHIINNRGNPDPDIVFFPYESKNMQTPSKLTKSYKGNLDAMSRSPDVHLNELPPISSSIHKTIKIRHYIDKPYTLYKKNITSRKETVKGYKQIDIVRSYFEAYRKIMENKDFEIIFRKLPQQHLNSKWVRIAMSKGCFLCKEYAIAVSHLDYAYRKSIFFPELSMYSTSLWHLNEKEKLKELVEIHFKNNKDDYRAWIILGNYLSLQLKRRAAVEALEEAVKIQPMAYEAWAILGHEYRLLGQDESARNAFQSAFLLNHRAEKAKDIRGYF